MISDNTTAFGLNAEYILTTALAVLFTWLIHEGAHWLAGEMLGYQMQMTLNTASPTLPFESLKDENLVSAAGPLVTLFQAGLVFILLKRTWKIFLYSFLVVCLYMLLLALGLSFINPNDEARISASLNIGTFTLPFLVVLMLLTLVWIISRQYRISRKANLATLGLTMLFSSIIILADQFFGVQII